MATPRPWPFEDDDRPSGSVQPLSQADLQAIVAHLGDNPDELLAGTIGDRPVVAIRVRASVGRPGGSAHAQWRRLRAAEWAAWTRTVPWRVAAVLAVAAVGGLLGSLLAPRLSLVLGGLAAVLTGWALRFKPSPEALAWRRGAAGERRTARLLDPLARHGWAVLHDLAIPGSQANLDHLVIGPGGVFVIDSKLYRGRLQLDPTGGCAMAATPSPPPCGQCRSRPTGPPGCCPTRAWRWCPSWLSMAPRSPGGRSSWTVSRSCRPGGCRACCARSRWCWGLSGSPPWPTRPESASTLPVDSRHTTLGDGSSRRLLERALAIREAHLGSDHSDTAQSLNNLAGVLGAQGDLVDARRLYERALAIREVRFGSDHPSTAWTTTIAASRTTSGQARLPMAIQHSYTGSHPMVKPNGVRLRCRDWVELGSSRV